MGHDDDAAELARLDALIAKHDADGSPDAQWRAADALYDKAALVERLEGDDASVDLYAEVIRRLEARREPGPRMLLIYAMDSLAAVHERSGRLLESRSLAERLIEENFDDAPPDAAEAVVHAGLLLGFLLREAGAYERATDLLERVIERYGQPGTPHDLRTRTEAVTQIAWTLLAKGETEGALARFEGVVRDLGDPAAADLRAILAQALVGNAYAVGYLHGLSEGKAAFKDVVDRFGDDEDPDVANEVAKARRGLAWRWSKDQRRGTILDLE